MKATLITFFPKAIPSSQIECRDMVIYKGRSKVSLQTKPKRGTTGDTL